MNLQVFEFDGSLSDPAYLAALVRDLLAHEQVTRRKYERDHLGRWMCQGCGLWLEPELLSSNERTERLECRPCWEKWLAADRQRAERQGGFDRPSTFDPHDGGRDE